MRQFLLYTGPLTLRGVVSSDMYIHFLSLTVSLSILLNEDDDERIGLLDYSRELLVYFVRKCKEIYGDTFTTYNVHSLIHLCDDSSHFHGPLNSISAFQFEKHLQTLKKCVKPRIQLHK